jgi:phenylacetate-CoA ligase
LHADANPVASSVLSLFHDAAATVPAYGAFLREHGIDAGAIHSLEEFKGIPLATKENYVRRYPLRERCRGGTLAGCEMVAVSSGSTGEPTIWPRATRDEVAVTARFEQVFRAFSADRRSTLAVVCFPLGTWVGGMYTAACCRLLAGRGYRVTVVTPGNHPDEILRIVPLLGPSFDQVALLGYPPFLKGLIDEGTRHGVPWVDYALKLVLAGEVVTEEWRSLVMSRASIRRPFHDIASLYGTADAGVLGTETPLSVAIRRHLATHPDQARALFGEARLPTLVQYEPCSRYFEQSDATLLFTCDGPAPLIRYHISDRGGVVPHEIMLGSLASFGFDPHRDIDRDERDAPSLPFVYVFGRSHHVVSYFGANVFPEMVSVGLEQPSVADRVTGKFVMAVREDHAHDAQFHVVAELAAGGIATGDLADAIAESIARQLIRLSSEYATYVPTAAQIPRVELRAFGDAEYFPPGVKHRWTRR